jgi:hypothetical protein
VNNLFGTENFKKILAIFYPAFVSCLVEEGGEENLSLPDFGKTALHLKNTHVVHNTWQNSVKSPRSYLK